MLLGGPAAEWALEVPEERDHWFRIWAARGLLWAYDGAARPAVLAGLHDEQWRVREMCAKVVARHLVGDALAAVLALRDDQVPRTGGGEPGGQRADGGRGVNRATRAGSMYATIRAIPPAVTVSTARPNGSPR